MENSTVELLANMRSSYDFRLQLSKISEQTTPWGILVLGVDGFKRINNLYSYSFGDRVLVALAQEISSLLDDSMLLFRMDGDCFAVLCDNAQEDGLIAFFQSMRQYTQNALQIDGVAVPLGISAGICFYPQDGVDEETLYRNVCIALASAKEHGGNRYALCSYQMLAKTQHAMRLREMLYQSISDNCSGFSLCYQPLMLAETSELYGCEALVRWRHPAFPEGVSPSQFVPVLEDSGLIIEAGRWILRTAVAQCAKWAEIMPNFQMSINVSSIQFEDPTFKMYVMKVLQEYSVPANLITLELTESDKIISMEMVANAFDFFRGQGIKIAFDDFGTGYASLDIFRQLYADELKIDRTFLERVTYDITDQKIISQLISLCDSINMYVCVEGIENEEMERAIKQMHPRLLQGYYYSRPIPEEEFYKRFLQFRSLSSQSVCNPQRTLYNPFSGPRPLQPLSMGEAMDNAYAAILHVMLDESFTLLSCNEGYRQMTGYTAKELEERFQNRALALVHPDDIAFVAAEIQRQLGMGDRLIAEFRMIRSNGSAFWVIGSGNLVKSRQGLSSLVVVLLDQDDLKQKALQREQDIRQKLQTEPLTGLYNRATIEEKLSSIIPTLDDTPHALYLIDILQFKKFNEQMGHLFGDQVLAELARRQTGLFPKDTLLARVGGDKYMGFLPLNKDWPDVDTLEKLLLDICEEPILFRENAQSVKISLGIVCYPQDGQEFYELYQQADRALSLSKELRGS